MVWRALEPSRPENPPDVFFCVFKKLRKHNIADRVLLNWAPMQVKLLFSKGLPKTQKTTKNNKTRKLSSHAGKTSFFEFLGCERPFVVFLCVFFCCLFVLAARTVFYGFLCDFELIFDSISWVFCSKVEVVFFTTLPSKTTIFKVPGLLFFSVFF